MKAKWYVYILRCSDDSLYTGITNDLERRIDEHNNNNKLAASYTRSRRPVKLVYHEKFNDKIKALKRENEIKKMSRKEKTEIIK